MKKEIPTTYEVTFEFDNEDQARMFLSYLSDGGGEQSFSESECHHRTDNKRTTFNYHVLNEGYFGPKVKAYLDRDKALPMPSLDEDVVKRKIALLRLQQLDSDTLLNAAIDAGVYPFKKRKSRKKI